MTHADKPVRNDDDKRTTTRCHDDDDVTTRWRQDDVKLMGTTMLQLLHMCTAQAFLPSPQTTQDCKDCEDSKQLTRGASSCTRGGPLPGWE